MKKKLISVTFIFILTVVGCSDYRNNIVRNIEIVDELETSNEAVTLNTVSMFGGTDANTVVYQNLIDEFMEENEHVTVRDNSTTADNEWKASIVADFAVGNEPDVLQFFTDAQATQLISTGKLVELEEIRKVYPEYAKDTFPAAIEMVANTDGVKRAVPTTGFMELLYCNMDLFDRYGIALPTDWNTFTNAIREFQTHGIIPVVVSLNSIPHYWIEASILYTAGLESYKEVPKTAPEDWVKGLELIKTLRSMGAFPAGTDTIDNDYATEMFRRKEAAMMFVGTWVTGSITDQENTIAVPFPGVPDQKAERGTMPAGFTSGFYITRSAWENPAKRDAAVKFVMKQTSQEAVTQYWKASGMVSKTATTIVWEGELSVLAESILSCERQAKDNFANPIDSRLDPEAFDIIVKGIVDISTGKRNAEDVLNKALKNATQDYYKRGN